MNNPLRPIARVVLALLIAVVIGIVGGMLFGCTPAHAQAPAVTDPPILAMPATLDGVALSVDMAQQRACAAWWVRDDDKYGDWHIASAYCAGAVCTAALDALTKPDALPALTKMRTANVTRADVQPCLDKIGAPPPAAWIVAPIASGQRPAYLLNADGTRGQRSGSAPTTLRPSDGSAPVPMWCNCRVRSVETTSSTYCAWATMRETADPAEPTRVALCRAQ